MCIYTTEANTIHVLQEQMVFALMLFVLKRDSMTNSLIRALVYNTESIGH